MAMRPLNKKAQFKRMSEELLIDAEWVSEADLAERLGVATKHLRDYRLEHFKPDAGFWKKEGRQILLSAEAVEVLTREFAYSVRDILPEAKKSPLAEILEPGTDELFEVVAKRIPANPYIVLGEWFGNPVRVRVPNSKKFVPGMRMKCRLVEGDVFALVGRGPRFKGKW
jgi:hypothetical protein